MSRMPGQAAPARTRSARTVVALIAIALLAVGLRIGAIVYTHATHAPAEENRIIARNLAAGRGFTFTEFTVTGPTAIRGPVYPMLLAVVGPNRMGFILAMNVIAGAATVFAAFALTHRLLSPLPAYRERGPDARPAIVPVKSSFAPLLAALLFAVWPTQLYAATLTQGLSLAVLLTVASLALAFRRTPASLIAAGLLAGLAALTEPVLALPLLLCAIILGWRDRQRIWHWQDAAVFVITAMLLIAPWLYRNAIVFGRPMPITSNFWRDAFLGNGDEIGTGGVDEKRHADANGNASRQETNRITRLQPREFDRLKVAEAKRADVFREWTMGWVRSNPEKYLRLCGDRLSGFGPSFHPLSKHWLYLTVASLEMLGLIVLVLLRQDAKAIRWVIVVLTLQLGLLANVIFTRGDARLSVFRSANFLIATAVAVSLIAERKSSARVA